MYGMSNQQIIQVSGEPGARAYQMMPNSSALLLDTTDSLVWLCQTDGAGYKSVTPFKIEPYTPPEPVDVNALLDRLNRLEAKIDESYSKQTERKQKPTESECDIQSDDAD